MMDLIIILLIWEIFLADLSNFFDVIGVAVEYLPLSACGKEKQSHLSLYPSCTQDEIILFCVIVNQELSMISKHHVVRDSELPK